MNTQPSKHQIKRLLSAHQGEQGQDRSAYLPSKSPLRNMSNSFYKNIMNSQLPLAQTSRKLSKSRDKMPLYEAILGEDFLTCSFYKHPYFQNVRMIINFIQPQKQIAKVRSEKRNYSKTNSQSHSPMLIKDHDLSKSRIMFQKEKQKVVGKSKQNEDLLQKELPTEKSNRSLVRELSGGNISNLFSSDMKLTLKYQKQIQSRQQEIVEAIQHCQQCKEKVNRIMSKPIDMDRKKGNLEQIFFDDEQFKKIEKALTKSISQSLSKVIYNVPETNKAQSIRQAYNIKNKDSNQKLKKNEQLETELLSLLKIVEQKLSQLTAEKGLLLEYLDDKTQKHDKVNPDEPAKSNPYKCSVLSCLKLVQNQQQKKTAPDINEYQD